MLPIFTAVADGSAMYKYDVLFTVDVFSGYSIL